MLRYQNASSGRRYSIGEDTPAYSQYERTTVYDRAPAQQTPSAYDRSSAYGRSPAHFLSNSGHVGTTPIRTYAIDSPRQYIAESRTAGSTNTPYPNVLRSVPTSDGRYLSPVAPQISYFSGSAVPMAPVPQAVQTASPPALLAGGHDNDYVKELGRASWKVMHEIANQFPDRPTAQEQQAALAFMESFAQLYPCQKCRNSFQQTLRQYPPDVSSGPAFREWMSFFHDQITRDLQRAMARSM